MAGNQGQFKPGWKGGPGRPKGRTFRDTLKALLAQPDPGAPGETRYESWSRQVIAEAERGDNDAKFKVITFLEGANPPDKGRPPEETDEAQSYDEQGNPIEP